jgi:hypothetical protein
MPYLQKLEGLYRQCYHGLADKTLRELSGKLMEWAMAGFSRLPPCFQGNQTSRILAKYYEVFTSRGRTPADDLLDLMASLGHDMITPRTLMQLEDKWAELIAKLQ